MLWVADITYIPTWAGFLYLAVVLDAFSRRIVGWSMAITLHTRVVLDALNMALRQRRPSGVIDHSDHSSQYTSIEFGKRCREAGVRPSMGSVGDAYDNAMAESFFATLECELLDRYRFKTQAEARIATTLAQYTDWMKHGSASPSVGHDTRRDTGGECPFLARPGSVGGRGQVPVTEVVQTRSKAVTTADQVARFSLSPAAAWLGIILAAGPVAGDTLIPRPHLSTKSGQAQHFPQSEAIKPISCKSTETCLDRHV